MEIVTEHDQKEFDEDSIPESLAKMVTFLMKDRRCWHEKALTHRKHAKELAEQLRVELQANEIMQKDYKEKLSFSRTQVMELEKVVETLKRAIPSKRVAKKRRPKRG